MMSLLILFHRDNNTVEEDGDDEVSICFEHNTYDVILHVKEKRKACLN